MNLLQGRAVETYTEALNQTKPPEVNDLIWLRPSRVAKQEMDLSGISLHSPWILVPIHQTGGRTVIGLDNMVLCSHWISKIGKGHPQANGRLGVPQRLRPKESINKMVILDKQIK